ncbi:hypothetical protein [Paenibacillus sp. 32O-W]|uniref:hypothetical protein n=1 Tax=Paenibacillus sp. 32O-W TaxID=1695218 RepID=UPI0021B54AB7|nr:hypothetical protein [Paenibacillus sp. 32O-W]
MNNRVQELNKYNMMRLQWIDRAEWDYDRKLRASLKLSQNVWPYATFKLALSLWTQAVAPQLAKEDIKIRSVDPGISNTLRKGKDSGLALWFERFMKFFPLRLLMEPTYYEGALGKHSNETGMFLFKDRIADLKFTEHAQRVLEKNPRLYIALTENDSVENIS